MSAEAEIDPTERCAADWLVRRDRGLSPAQEQELAHWLAADERHAAVFNALAETWDLVAELPSPGRQEPDGTATPTRNPRFWLPAALATAAAVAIAFAGWQKHANKQAAATDLIFETAATTEVGGWRKMDLPDGSVIQLNTDSAVEVRMDVAARHVRLVRGEAHFSVARDAARPFVVSAAAIDVRVIGTVFNVRLRPASVDVLVTEGTVRVAPPGTPTAGSISAGQKVSIGLGHEPEIAPAPVADTEVRQTLAWQTRRLDFDNTTLLDIVTEFNRYNRHRLTIADPRLNDRRFGGTFPAADHGTFVRMLETNFGIRAETVAGETFLRLREP